MRNKREKDYWLKRHERFTDAARAQARAAALRMHEHTAHVTVSRTDEGYEVSFSVAKWYLEELERAGGKL